MMTKHGRLREHGDKMVEQVSNMLMSETTRKYDEVSNVARFGSCQLTQAQSCA